MNTKRILPRAAVFLGLVGLSVAAYADAPWPSNVRHVAAESGKTVTVVGDLARGTTLSLDWAALSSMACFPATENKNFEGNHVLFSTNLPKNSEMTIEAIPDDASTDLSVYAYSIGTTNYAVPPTVTSCTACEAGYDAQHDHNPGASERVKLTAITNPYNVVIGVAGTKGTKSGKFKLKVTIAPRS